MTRFVNRDSNEKLFLKYTKARINDMVADIHSERFSGKSVIVCWSHKQILELAEMLGAEKHDLPEKWKGKRFGSMHPYILDSMLLGSSREMEKETSRSSSSHNV
jgi:hypothetical protein